MSRLETAITKLQSTLVGDDDFDQSVRQVSVLARDAVTDCEEAAVTLMVDGAPTNVASTGPGADALGHAQQHAGLGPAIEACRLGELLLQTDDEVRDRFPRLAEALRHTRIRTLLTVPLIVRDAAIGALGLYSTRPQAFTDLDVELTKSFARQAATVLANARRLQQAQTLCAQLEQAMLSRATIEQAKGALMATFAIEPGDAFDLLVQESQNGNAKLRSVAEQVVDAASRGHPVQMRGTKNLHQSHRASSA